MGYATNLALACPVTTTQGATDLLAALQNAIETSGALLGRPLGEGCVDPATGETTPLVVMTENAPATTSVAVARRFATRPHLTHVFSTLLGGDLLVGSWPLAREVRRSLW